MANDVKLQEGHPLDENLRPLKIGDKSSSIELSQQYNGSGARVTGELKANSLNISGNTTLMDDVNIAATKKLYLDGGGDTFIIEDSDDNVNIFVGNDKLMTFGENGDNGNLVFFKDACVGFTKIAETFSDDSILATGGTHDTHIDFRFSNKISLAVTADITNLNLIFPFISGNFLLLLTYDGDWDITNWKVYEYDESTADGDADVLWPGGTQPNTTASGVDIFSFFYDATPGADKCYGVASLAFATP